MGPGNPPEHSICVVYSGLASAWGKGAAVCSQIRLLFRMRSKLSAPLQRALSLADAFHDSCVNLESQDLI